METTKLSTKGQVVLPKVIREARQWSPGTEFQVEEVEEGVLLRPVRPVPVSRVEEVSGCLRYRGKAKTVEQMERAIAKGISERHGRGRY